MKHQIPTIAALAALTIASPTSASTLLFADNFNTSLMGDGAFNTPSALSADQSGTAATKSYTTSLGGGWDGAYQRGNSGTWLMYAGLGGFGSTNMRGSLNYDIASAANTLGLALKISFNISVTNSIPTAPPEAPGDNWTSFTIGTVNPFVNDIAVGFGSLFRDNGGTQQFSNGGAIASTATFTDNQLITFLLSDSTGSGSAFTSNGNTDIVKMYIGDSLIQTFTNLDLNATDQFISFHANQTVTQIDNLSITAVPEPSAALLGGLGLFALLRRRRS